MAHRFMVDFDEDAQVWFVRDSSLPGLRTEALSLDALVAKWAPYVQSAFGADVDMWRERLTLQFAKGDETNLRAALLRDSFEGAMATLVGRGDRVNDAEILKASAVDGLKSALAIVR